MNQALSVAQIIVALTVIVLVLLQQRGSALGSAFGAEGAAYATRRGIQKQIFLATIVLAVVFIILALLPLFVGPASPSQGG